jgi:hypothetical protein
MMNLNISTPLVSYCKNLVFKNTTFAPIKLFFTGILTFFNDKGLKHEQRNNESR